jgi:hypothetical protein
MSKIAIVSFGSLVFEPRNLKIQGQWNETGPIIKCEFSRISSNKRLTVVVDENNGSLVQSLWAESAFTNINLAIRNFREREGSDLNKISVLNVRTGEKSESCNRHQETSRTILNWAREEELDHVIWSGLGVRFLDAIGVRFNVENALEYLNTLEQPDKLNSIRYILNVHPNIQTNFRRAFNDRFTISFPENEE